MSEITDYLAGYLGELENYMERLNSNRLSRKDRRTFFEMSNEYYDIFQKSMKEGQTTLDSFPKPLLEELKIFNDNIIGPLSDGQLMMANQYYASITGHSNDYMEAVERIEMQVQIFRNDAEIIRLQNEKIQMMQRLVNIDLKREGQISPETMSILEVQNSEVLNGRVREIGEWERKDPDHDTNVQRDPDKEIGAVADLPAEDEEVIEDDIEYIQGKRVLNQEELDKMLHSHIREGQGGGKTLDLSNCIISNYVFKGDLDNISFDHANIQYCEFRNTKSAHVDMRNAEFTGCKFTQAEFDHSQFDHAALNNSKVQSSMFRECSFDDAYLKQSPLTGSVFYRTSFQETRIRGNAINDENVFHECGSPEETVRAEITSMSKEQADQYKEDVKRMFSNDGYSYSWELNGVDIENQEAKLSIKILQDEETVEIQKYHAILDPDTYAISHIDTGRQQDLVAKMFVPEMDAAIKNFAKEHNIAKESVKMTLNFPYMTKETFLEAKEMIKSMGAKFNPQKKVWYVEQSIGQDKIDHINDYLAKHDDAVYLKLPPTGPQKFKQMIDQIKQDGARYNPNKRRWYITEAADRSKFTAYLPVEKASVHGKLNQYKADAAKLSEGSQNHQKKEALERM